MLPNTIDSHVTSNGIQIGITQEPNTKDRFGVYVYQSSNGELFCLPIFTNLKAAKTAQQALRTEIYRQLDTST